MSASLSFRLVRAAVFAVVCFGVSLTAHIVAGGVAVPVSQAIGGLALAFGVTLLLSGRERTVSVILPLLAGLQIVLHVVFSTTHVSSLTGDASHLAVTGHVQSGMVPVLGMFIMHGWAVVLAALWLARGEAVLWSLLRRVGVEIHCGLTVYRRPVHMALRVTPAAESRVLRSAVLRHVLSRRGPPRPVTVASA